MQSIYKGTTNYRPKKVQPSSTMSSDTHYVRSKSVVVDNVELIWTNIKVIWRKEHWMNKYIYRSENDVSVMTIVETKNWI